MTAWPELVDFAPWLELSAEGRAAVTVRLAAALGEGWAPEAERPEQLAALRYRPLDMVFVAVPGGLFTMGLREDEREPLRQAVCGPQADEHYDRELAPGVHASWGPARDVEVRPFLCACDFVQHDESDLSLRPAMAEGLPYGVSADRAAPIVRALRAHGLRLPSEAEWEWIAREGENQGSFVTYLPPGRHGLALESSSGSKIWDVLYPLAGGEWVADGWHDSYDGAPGDSRAWAPDPTGRPQIVRGGLSYGWQSPYEALCLHAAYRCLGSSGLLRAARDLP